MALILFALIFLSKKSYTKDEFFNQSAAIFYIIFMKYWQYLLVVGGVALVCWPTASRAASLADRLAGRMF